MPSLTLPSVPESVSAAVGAAEAGGHQASLSDEVLIRVSLAVGEAVANAVEHGTEAASEPVRVEITPKPGQLAVVVCDGGTGVDARQVEEAELPDDLLQTHGRGLYLIRVLTDRCEADGGCLRLWFRERSA